MKANELKEKTIQIYGSIQSPVAFGQMTYEQFLNGGRKVDSYRDIIKELRKCEYKSDEYKEIKNSLVCGTPASYSSSKRARMDAITEDYNVITIDIDKQDNSEFFNSHSLEELKWGCIELPGCFCSMLSCGGQGVVAYFLVHDLKRNEKLYQKYFIRLFKSVGVQIDENAKNFRTRKRFISYDENAIFDWDKKELVLDDEVIKKLNNYTETKPKLYTENKSDNSNYTVKTSFDGTFNPVTIEYLDNLRRFKYCATIKKLLGCSLENLDLVKRIYDYSYKLDGKKHNVNEAYSHIEDHWKRHSTFGISKEIVEELISLGVIEDNSQDNESTQTESNIIELIEGEEGNQWLFDRKEDVINSFKGRINLLVAGTGVGKTEFWNQMSKLTKKVTMFDGSVEEVPMKILVVEPFNSIVQGKYDENSTNIAVGTGNYINKDHIYNATNYNKFVFDVKNGNSFLDTDYIVLDESHMIGTQDFRKDILVEFCQCVNRVIDSNPYTKVILQTATPSNESYFFDIDNTITIKKHQKKFIGVNFLNIQTYKGIEGAVENYDYDILSSICYLTKIHHDENRKVFVYWTDGAERNMEIVKDRLKIDGINIAIMHNRNREDEEMQRVLNERTLGKLDGIISSCMFGAGCDINDKCNAAVIIVGNNPYQEDIQAIGRFRKSRNIIVDILCKSSIQKIDCSKMLEMKKWFAIVSNNAKNNSLNSIVSRYSYNDDKDWSSYIETSKYYYSDIKRKFDYFKSLGDIVLMNDYEFDDVTQTYTIVDDNGMPIIMLIDDDNEILEQIRKSQKEGIESTKTRIYNELRRNPSMSLDCIIERCQKFNSLVDWLQSIVIIQSHYSIEEFMKFVPMEEFMNMSRKKMRKLFEWKLKTNRDKVEEKIIDFLVNVQDNRKDMWLQAAVAYCYWVRWSSKENPMKYDMMVDNRGYVYYEKNWLPDMLAIVKVPKHVRDYILNYSDVLNSNNFDSSIVDAFFDYDLKIEENIQDSVQNKFVSDGEYRAFLNYVIRKHNATTTKKKQNIGGKIGGKISSPKKKLVCVYEIKNRKGEVIAKPKDEFSSCEEASKKIRVGSTTISKYIKLGLLKKID